MGTVRRELHPRIASGIIPDMATSTSDKVRENRLRRMAERQGLRLQKSRRRDPRALDYETYGLVDVRFNTLEVGDPSNGYGLTLDEVEAALMEGRKPRAMPDGARDRSRQARQARPR